MLFFDGKPVEDSRWSYTAALREAECTEGIPKSRCECTIALWFRRVEPDCDKVCVMNSVVYFTLKSDDTAYRLSMMNKTYKARTYFDTIGARWMPGAVVELVPPGTSGSVAPPKGTRKPGTKRGSGGGKRTPVR